MATTDEEMRGTDLRAPIKGVTLVIAKSFSCQRNADQGLMRICRYGDPGLRVIAQGIRLVNADKERDLNKTLYRFAQLRKK